MREEMSPQNTSVAYRFYIAADRADMQNEAQTARLAILDSGNIPYDNFNHPAHSDSPWQITCKMIDESDAVLLLLGWKAEYKRDELGQPTLEIERQYKYAKAQGKSIIVILFGRDRKYTPVERAETNEEAQNSIVALRDSLSNDHLLKFCEYDQQDELKQIIQLGAFSFIEENRSNDSIGLVPRRLERTLDQLDELERLRRKVVTLEEALATYEGKVDARALPMDKKIGIEISRYYLDDRPAETEPIETLQCYSTLNNIFNNIGRSIEQNDYDYQTREKCAAAVWNQSEAGERIDEDEEFAWMGDNAWRETVGHFCGVGLLQKSANGTIMLTDKGRSVYHRLQIIGIEEEGKLVGL